MTRPSDDVRTPEVPRGSVVIVTRYREEVAKVALVNPDDLALLERSHELIEALDQPAEPPLPSNATRDALEREDRPHPDARVEDAGQIAAILRL